MKVSRRSWHYRLHVFVFTFFNWESYGPLPAIQGRRWNHQPTSLCSYFWSTLALTLLTPVLSVMMIGIAVAASPIFGVVFGGIKTHEVYREHRPKKKVEEKPPGLLRSYVKARKQKVCPLIEVVD